MNQEELVAEKIAHTVDMLRFELKSVRTQLDHSEKLATSRLEALESNQRDQEARLRQVQDAAVQFKVLAGLATGGGLISVVALLRAIFTP
jgi:chaperonin cofactor prefoldin